VGACCSRHLPHPRACRVAAASPHQRPQTRSRSATSHARPPPSRRVTVPCDSVARKEECRRQRFDACGGAELPRPGALRCRRCRPAGTAHELPQTDYFVVPLFRAPTEHRFFNQSWLRSSLTGGRNGERASVWPRPPPTGERTTHVGLVSSIQTWNSHKVAHGCMSMLSAVIHMGVHNMVPGRWTHSHQLDIDMGVPLSSAWQ
jgi:hypothetical protein